MRSFPLIFLLLIPFLASTQPFTLDPKIKPVELKLYKYNPPKQPNAKGKISITDVTQVKDTLYFFVKGVSIYSPVYVGVNTKDKSSPVDIRLHKMNWKKADRSGSTGTDGHWQEKFKTENDFGIMIIARNKPSTYAMVVWAGDEAKFNLPSVFRKEVAGGGSNFFKKNLMYIIIGVLAIIIGVLFFKLKNRKNDKKTV